nr:MAG TPA: Ogr/Delta-like zinc finger protein [Caudoviricetes sp.]
MELRCPRCASRALTGRSRRRSPRSTRGACE